MKKLTISVLRGGVSRERDVSLESGEAIASALESLGHKVIRADIGPDNLSALDSEADVFFVALHGAFGEDGRVQEILEGRGLCYTGSGPAACALTMNKVRTKQKLLELGLPTPRHVLVKPSEFPADLHDWSPPLVVKPVSEGSSLSCHIVKETKDLNTALGSVLETYGEALVEEFIPGMELTVGILGDEPLPPIEIRPKIGFYDYHAKYQDEKTAFLFDIDLSSFLLEEIKKMSLAAHRGLGCRDFSRVDWRVDKLHERPFILEVNAIPGFTGHSLLPMAARQRGLSLPELCSKIIEMALERSVIIMPRG